MSIDEDAENLKLAEIIALGYEESCKPMVGKLNSL